MPTKNALATARLRYTQSGARWEIALQVWNRSYDHPDPARRNSLISRVELVDLPGAATMTVHSIKDRYGVDSNAFWARQSGPNSAGFDWYTECNCTGCFAPNQINLIWGAYTGIYDERCAADPAADRMRLQSFVTAPRTAGIFNYLLSPVTFAFAIDVFSPSARIRVVHSEIGGNQGNPAQQHSTLPQESFFIGF